MRSKRALPVCLMSAMTLAVSACANTPANDAPTAGSKVDGVSVDLQEDAAVTVSTSEYKQEGPYTIAALNQGPINGFGLTWDITIEHAAKQNSDIEELIMLAANGDASTQINQLEDVIQQKPDAIVMSPMGRAALSASVNRAIAAGIPVIVCTNAVEGKKYTSYVDVDLYAEGFAAAEALAERLNGKGNVALFHGIPGADAAETWKLAAEDAFKKHPDIKVVASEYANWSVANAREKAAAMLAANPTIDGVYAGGAEMASGVMLAFEAADRPQPVYGVAEPTNGFLRLAGEHDVKFTATPQQPAPIAVACLDTALKVLKGEDVKKFTRVEDERFTEADLDKKYVPELNDDFVGPSPLPLDVYIDGGMARK
jgi:ribose transport system substrate-binding protein